MTPARRVTRRLAGAGIGALLIGAGVQTWDRASNARPASAAAAAPTAAADINAGTLIRMEPETLALAQIGIETVHPKPMHEALEVTGTVEPDQAAIVRVTPQVGGKTVSVTANVGDRVSAGQVLAKVASPELAQAQAEFHHASHRRERARTHLERQRKLARLGVFGRPRVDEARTRTTAARGEVGVAQNELAGARSQVSEARSELAAVQEDSVGVEADIARVQGGLAEAEAGVGAAKAALSQIRTALGVAQSRFERYQILLKEELVSRQDWEQAQAEARKAEAEVEAGRAAVVRAEARVSAERAALQAARARAGTARSRIRQAEAKITTAEARQAECEARLEAAQKASEIAAESFTREEAVLRGGFLTSKEIVEAEADLREAEHDLEAAETRVRLLGGTPGGGNVIAVASPQRGRITERQVTLGEAVTPERSLFTLVDLKTVWVQLHVYQKDLARVQSGDAVVLTTDAAPGRSFRGTVAQLGDRVDPTARTVQVRCVLPNPGDVLRPSLFVKGTITPRARRSRLAVPAEAVQELEGSFVVFVPAEAAGEFRPREVRRGETVGGQVEILTGLQSGERVVVRNALMIKAQTLKEDVEE